MILGYHYHIPVYRTDKGELYTDSVQGILVDSMAGLVEKLYLFMHTPPEGSLITKEYLIQAKNIELVELGQISECWKRFLNPGKYISHIGEQISKCDVMLLRCPSPLSPYFYFRYKKKTKFSLLIVGNYLLSSYNLKQPFLKKWAIVFLCYIYNILQSRVVGHSLSFVNSDRLYKENFKPGRQIIKTFTSTLSRKSFFRSADKCTGDRITLLFTGRIDPAKGMYEILYAANNIRKRGVNMHFTIVGWEEREVTVVKEQMIRKAQEIGFGDNIHFFGKQKIGEELNRFYRDSDIYLIPSYQEGFPRTIWEAMCNSVPVIATTVGGIPGQLTNMENAILIEPRSVQLVEDAINLLITDGELRRKIINNAYDLVGTKTLELHTEELITKMKAYAERK